MDGYGCGSRREPDAEETTRVRQRAVDLLPMSAGGERTDDRDQSDLRLYCDRLSVIGALETAAALETGGGSGNVCECQRRL